MTVLVLLMDHLIQRGIEFVVVAPKLGDEITQYRGQKVIGVPGVRFPLYPELRLGPPTLHTYREVRDFQPDIAHFIHPTLVGTGGLMMAKRLSVPTLASFHLDLANMAQYFGLGFLEPVVWWYTRTNFNAADYALAPSRLVQNDMLRHGVRNVGLWRRGVDAEQFHPRHASAEMRARLSDGHPEDTILLYVGRLSSEKAIDGSARCSAGARHAAGGCGRRTGPRRSASAVCRDTCKFMGYLRGEGCGRRSPAPTFSCFPRRWDSAWC